MSGFGPASLLATALRFPELWLGLGANFGKTEGDDVTEQEVTEARLRVSCKIVASNLGARKMAKSPIPTKLLARMHA